MSGFGTKRRKTMSAPTSASGGESGNVTDGPNSTLVGPTADLGSIQNNSERRQDLPAPLWQAEAARKPGGASPMSNMRRRQFITLLGGAAAGWPLPALAQQRAGRIPRVGFLLNVRSELVDALFKGLRDAGYIEGQNIVFETRVAGNMLDRIDQFANQLVALNCDLIFAAGPYAIKALTNATKTIPLVAIDLESDPVANRWAASIARPGGNLTGFFLDLPELGGKQIELLKEALPNLTRVGFLWDSTVGLTQFRATEAVARTAGVARPEHSAGVDQPVHSLSSLRRADGLWPELPGHVETRGDLRRPNS
jgi:hypothetical protein